MNVLVRFISAHAAQATLHDGPGPQAADAQAADTHRCRQVLHDLIGMGTGLAHLLHQQAHDHTLPYDPAGAITAVVRHVARPRGHWPPPPS